MVVLIVGGEVWPKNIDSIEQVPEYKLLADELEDRGESYKLVDATKWPGDSPVSLQTGTDSVLVDDEEFSIEEIDGAFFSSYCLFKPDFPHRFPDNSEVVKQLNQLREYRSLFRSIAKVLRDDGVNVIPNRFGQTIEKTWQIKRYEQESLPVPETVITNDSKTAERFYGKYDRVIAKPLTYGSLVKEVTDEDISQGAFDSLSEAPVQFQEHVEGDDVRVFVLDGNVKHAFEIDTEELSYQTADEKGESVEIAQTSLSDREVEIAEKAAEISRLKFSAVDLLRGENPVILEANETPRFSRPTVQTGADIPGDIVDYLLK